MVGKMLQIENDFSRRKGICWRWSGWLLNALASLGGTLMCVIGASVGNLDYDLLFSNTFLNVFQHSAFIRRHG